MFLLSKIKIGAVALIIIGGLLGGLYIQSLQAQRAKLTQAAEWNRQELAAMEQANEALHQNLAAHQAALAEREAHQSALTVELGNLNYELEKLYGIDCEAKSWSDTGVPAGVRQRLRHITSATMPSSDTHTTPGSLPPAGPGTDVQRADQR